jgi:hypothetical protein
MDVAERACFPPEFVAIPTMIAAGSVVGRQMGIKPTRFDDFLVVPNLWGGLVAPPGAMKTYAVAEGTKPVQRLTVTAHDRFEVDRQIQAGTQVKLKAELEALERAIKDAVKPPRPSWGEAAKLDPAVPDIY